MGSRMDAQALPTFKYHPDPLSTGSVQVDADTVCASCEQARGYIYAGPVYSEQDVDLDEHLCPWCVADGSAAEKFEACFNDAGTMDDVSDDIVDEIEQRTPGFVAWQEAQWLTCCNDAAAFLGLAGADELRKKFPKAIPAVKDYLKDEYDLSGGELKEFMDSLDKDGQPTAYIFQCLHCHAFLAYVDET
ncbi:MAG TPA: CbrC family protein [Blastocatellia bacterium]|nr:CbrC family protein [Blastocatellia bacterium]